jgi:hypothetical protein
MIFATIQQATEWNQHVYPNPCAETLTIEHDKLTTWQGTITAIAIDLQGRKTPIENFHSIGKNNIEIPIHKLATGQYSIHLLCNRESLQTPWISVIH